MASSGSQSLLQCSSCEGNLNLESKTLPCLHSFCHLCLDRQFEGQINGNGQCPKCHEHLTLDQLSLSPFLIRSLRRALFESTNLKCDLCRKDQIESISTTWCHDCQTLFCVCCNRFHKNLHPKHHTKEELDGMERDNVIKLMMTDMCSLHRKAKDLYCEQCNIGFCDTCYQNHSADSPGCSSQPLYMREEALKQKLQGPTLVKEMDDLEMSLRRMNERMRKFTEEQNTDCDSKCQQSWQNLEEMILNARRETNELCEEMRQITGKQVERWHHQLEENEKVLKQLEIWRINLKHLLSDCQEDVDVVCGLSMLGSKLSSQHNKSVEPEEKCQLSVTFSNWWLQFTEQLKNEKIGSVCFMGKTLPAVPPSAKELEELSAANELEELSAAKELEELPAASKLAFHKQWSLNMLDIHVNSIQVSEEDNHIFLFNNSDQSIIGFTEEGECVCDCLLFSQNLYRNFLFYDMCLISPDILVVSSRHKTDNYFVYKLHFLKRIKMPPFLTISKVIDLQLLTFCHIDKSIFALDQNFQIISITNEGENKKVIRSMSGLDNSARIRADPSTGNIWAVNYLSQIFCYKSYGVKLQSEKIDEEITDFYLNEFGNFYFCNREGIFSFSPVKVLLKFENKSQVDPKIFVLKNKIFVSLCIDNKRFIKIFKILD